MSAPAPDHRSVGELLASADLAARECLWDPNADNAQARVRSWVGLVEEAARVWELLPTAPWADQQLMTEVFHRRTSLAERCVRFGWPGRGELDPTVDEATEALARAGALLRGRVDHTRQPTPPVDADAAASRVRLMHTLLAATHGTALSVSAYVRNRDPAAGPKGLSGQGARQACRATSVTLAGIESRVQAYLTPRWPRLLHGEHREPVDPGRLEHALAVWAVTALRSMAVSPEPDAVLFVSRVQGTLGRSLQVLGAASASLGAVDPQQYASRAAPAFAALTDGWATLQGSFPASPRALRLVDRHLLAAGQEVLAAAREITLDGGATAARATIAARVDLREAGEALHRNVTTAADLAASIRQAVADPAMPVPGYDAAEKARRRVAAGSAAHALVQAATIADSAGSFLTARPTTHRSPDPTIRTLSPVPRAGREHDRRAITAMRAEPRRAPSR